MTTSTLSLVSLRHATETTVNAYCTSLCELCETHDIGRIVVLPVFPYALRGKRVGWLRVAVECTLPPIIWAHRGLPGLRAMTACHMAVAIIVYAYVAAGARSHAARLCLTGSFTAHYLACMLVCAHQGHWLLLCYMSLVMCAFAATRDYAAP